jgi:ABC-type multidrug transport system ATPase subunit
VSADPKNPPCLAVRGLRHERGGRLVLDDVSLDVHAGTVTALLGESGSGKTSLLRCLVGLDRPLAGRVEFEGADIASLDACTLRRRVGLVGQTAVMFAGDVRSNLAYGLGTVADDELSGALADAGLDGSFLDRDARALSVGQSARVAIARSLVRGPRAMLLDEPTAALDEQAARGIEHLVGALAANGIAVLLITHDLGQAERTASRSLRIAAGRILA